MGLVLTAIRQPVTTPAESQHSTTSAAAAAPTANATRLRQPATATTANGRVPAAAYGSY